MHMRWRSVAVVLSLLLGSHAFSQSACTSWPTGQTPNEQPQNVHPSGVVDGNNGVFTLPSAPPDPTCVRVAVSGRELKAANDFHITGTALIFASNAVPHPGDVVTVSMSSDVPLTTRRLQTQPGVSRMQTALLHGVLTDALLRDVSSGLEYEAKSAEEPSGSQATLSSRSVQSIGMLQRRMRENSRSQARKAISRLQRSGGYEGTNNVTGATLYSDLLGDRSSLLQSRDQSALHNRAVEQQQYRSLTMLGARLDYAEQLDTNRSQRGR